jgi:hypothetical protein
MSTDPNDGELTIPLPSGRELVYRNVRRITGNIVAKLPRLGKLMDVKLYGGLLAENATQALARDVFMDRCMALEDAGYEILDTGNTVNAAKFVALPPPPEKPQFEGVKPQ